jgi:acetyl-CoA C-acetyltransferase
VPVIVSACRTPIGKYGKSLLEVSAPKLGAIAIEEALKRARARAKDVDEVIMGNVISAGLGQNLARQAAVLAGIPFSTGCMTINQVCGSGLQAVMLAAQSLKAGDNELLVVAGGTENMSNTPHLVNGLRWGVKYGDTMLVDAMINDGLRDAFHHYHMGITGENVARRFKISRKEADEFAYESHMKAAAASKNGIFDEEIVPVEVPRRDGTSFLLSKDECIRPNTTLEKLSKLEPAFKPGGILTAGNSSQLSDGAAVVVVTTEEKAQEMGVEPLARIVAYGTGGVEPARVMESPIPTTKAVLRKTGMTVDDIDLFEHNEAYSTASIAVRQGLGIDDAKFNIYGGAVALGHPIGCSGTRVLTTLLYAMKRTGKKRGLATACLGGGNGVTMMVER